MRGEPPAHEVDRSGLGRATGRTENPTDLGAYEIPPGTGPRTRRTQERSRLDTTKTHENDMSGHGVRGASKCHRKIARGKVATIHTKIGDLGREQPGHEIFLGTKVVVERGLRESTAHGDIRHRRLANATLADDASCAVKGGNPGAPHRITGARVGGGVGHGCRSGRSDDRRARDREVGDVRDALENRDLVAHRTQDHRQRHVQCGTY